MLFEIFFCTLADQCSPAEIGKGRTFATYEACLDAMTPRGATIGTRLTDDPNRVEALDVYGKVSGYTTCLAVRPED